MQIYLCVQVTVCWERTGEGGTTEDITVTIARRPGRGLGLSVVGRRDGPGQLPLVTTSNIQYWPPIGPRQDTWSNTGLLLVQESTSRPWCRGAWRRGRAACTTGTRSSRSMTGTSQTLHRSVVSTSSLVNSSNCSFSFKYLRFQPIEPLSFFSRKNHYFFQDAAVACLKTAVGDIKMVVRRLKILTK